MSRTEPRLAIDARPRGPRGPLAVVPVRGRTVLGHLLEAIDGLVAVDVPVAVHIAAGDETAFDPTGLDSATGSFALTEAAPAPGCLLVRTDRLYDRSRLRKAVRQGLDPESAVIWRLDTPSGLAGAGDELVRRQSFQPLGHFWALAPARRLARWLAPTRVRPNAVTLLAGSLVASAAGLVAFGPAGGATNLATAVALAVALVLDTADGHLARLQGTASEFGRWLDGWLDEVGDMALHAGVAWAAFTRTGSVGWLLLGMLYAMGKFLFVAATTDTVVQTLEQANTGPSTPSRPGPLARVVRLAGHADVRWHLWIALAALGRLDAALAAYAVYFPARAVLVAARKAVRRG